MPRVIWKTHQPVSLALLVSLWARTFLLAIQTILQQSTHAQHLRRNQTSACTVCRGLDFGRRQLCLGTLTPDRRGKKTLKESGSKSAGAEASMFYRGRGFLEISVGGIFPFY